MYTQVKKKEIHKKKTKRLSIEGKIPEIPRLSDFQDCVESVGQRDLLVSDLHKEYEGSDAQLAKIEKQDEIKKENLEKNDNKFFEPEENFESNEKLQIFESEKSNSSCDPPVFQNSEEKLESSSNDFCTKNVQVNSIIPNTKVNYNDLTLEVQKLKLQNEPSAPSEEGKWNDVKYSNTEECIYKKKLYNSEELLDIRKFNFIITLGDILSPLNDEKLSEFYFNHELIESKAYISEFINKETNDEIKNNKLYKLLVEYVLLREQIKYNQKKVQDFCERLNICLPLIWTLWKEEMTEKAKCKDGNIITLSHNYTQAEFNDEAFSEFNSILGQIRHVVFNVYVMDHFKCSILKLKIEYYLQSLLLSCKEFYSLNSEAPVVLSPPSTESYFKECLSSLKTAISVLFIFQRKQFKVADKEFIEEIRQWLSDLVAVLLRVGYWKDHVFLLNHIMRCPGGISEWAPQFVQLPYSPNKYDPFNSRELNHIMTVMNILLNPIEQRANFIKKWESDLENDVNMWTIIDSDGEIENDVEQPCPLRENDLVSVLNQIPFSSLFKSILKFNDEECKCVIVTSEYLLKLFSFLTEFVKIMFYGLKEYSSCRYRQFAKRLGRLIYHSVQYATDMFMLFKMKKVSDNEMLSIQIEYDSFFLKSAKIIYSAKKHGTWQFLATIPYNVVSSNTILKLFGILQLNNDKEDCFTKVDFSNFEEEFLKLPEEEQFYLLTAFSNMALAREKSEIEFIKVIVYQLFYIGFLSLSTRDRCYKNVNSLVCSICSCYPFLLSHLLDIQRNMFLLDPSHCQRLCCYLWLKLPINLWQPNKVDLETLSSWLLEPIDSVPNELARIILKSLNYGIHQGGLFMPPQSHHSIAMMVLRSNVHFVPDSEVGVIKNVSNFVWSQTVEQGINEWTWNILFKLRLHLLDQAEAVICNVFHDLPNFLKSVPNIESNFELHELVLKKHPVAIYIALMTTTLGHSVPLMFEVGFELVEELLNVGRYDAAVMCLEYMTLFFLECNDSLYKCEKFIHLLSRLTTFDNSYIQLAKNLISNNFPGPALKHMEVMLQSQINFCKAFSITKFSNVVSLWLFSLTKIPMWNSKPGILYLIDKLLQSSFFDIISEKAVETIFENLLDKSTPNNDSKNSFSSFISWVNSKYNPPSLLSKGFNGNVPWFSYKLIQMEHEIFEKRNLIWPTLLKELYYNSEKKTNIDNSLKNVCTLLKVPVRPSSVLAIYKWSYQILETDFSHPLLPLIWERFFSLYLCRVPEVIDSGSVGRKFFDGTINQSLFMRLKQRLKDTCDYYKELSFSSEKALMKSSENIKENNCFKLLNLFNAYSLWLDDVRLHERSLNVHTLTLNYYPNLLEQLLNNNQSSWLEFLEFGCIKEYFSQCSLNWSKMRNRQQYEKEYFHVKQKDNDSPIVRIIKRCETYETPLPPPSVRLNKYTFCTISFDTLVNWHKMLDFIKPYLNELEEHSKQYLNKLNENIAIESKMKELLPRLYITTETQKVLKGHCNGLTKSSGEKDINSTCVGPAVVSFKFKESDINNQVNESFIYFKRDFDQNVKNILLLLPPNVSSSTVLIDFLIEELIKEYNLASKRENSSEIAKNLRKTGVKLFYRLIESLCDTLKHTPFFKSIFESYVDDLGKTFIEENAEEIERVLTFILNNNTFGDMLCTYFNPNVSWAFSFVENYSMIIKSNSNKRFMVLSKFDVSGWLSNRKPKVFEISHLLNAVGLGLKSTSTAEENTLKVLLQLTPIMRNGTLQGIKNFFLLQLLNHHLEILLMYDFPQHYGEVLNFLIEASQNQTISASTWFSFLNSLAGEQINFEIVVNKNSFENGRTVKYLKYYFKKYATEQNLISLELIKGTISLLGTTFKSERLLVGNYGLYRKYLPYMEPFIIFFGMLSYSVVAKEIETDTGSLSDKIAQRLWPLLSDLYSPWTIPNIKENFTLTTEHIQKTKSCEQNVFLPWAVDNSCYAFFCVSLFIESIQFAFDALPGSNHILSYVWNFYVEHFAHIYVKDYILNVIHDCFLSLPWESFFPTLQDVELMVRLVDQFLPLSHSFLGNIFVHIKWTYLVQYCMQSLDKSTATKLHIYLLYLLVKLPFEPTLKQSGKIMSLLIESKNYAWYLVDSDSYERTLNWFITNCDPRIILMEDKTRLENFELDYAILRLLRSCAGYDSSNKLLHPNSSVKKKLFLRACIKCLIMSNKRFKCKDSPSFKKAICTLWEDVEMVVPQVPSEYEKVNETESFIAEFFAIFTESELGSIVETILSTYLLNPKSRLLIFGIIRATRSIENPKICGGVIETALENYFNFTENCEWSEIITVLPSISQTALRFEEVLIENNYLLTFYGLSLKNFRECSNKLLKPIFCNYFKALSEAKPGTSSEPKLVLFIIYCMESIAIETKNNIEERISHLTKLFDISNNLFKNKGMGFLSVLGLKKTFSDRFQLMCLITCSWITIFLKKNCEQLVHKVDQNILSLLDTADSDKLYHNIQEHAKSAKNTVKELTTFEQIVSFLKLMGLELFNKSYLK